jgi:hypothetical protein
MSDQLLPESFGDLEPFARTWCPPTEAARYARRLAASPRELLRTTVFGDEPIQ